MNLERIINTLTQWFSMLYYRRWERWELWTVAMIGALVLVTLLLRAHRKAAAESKAWRQRSPLIGIK